jgi:uncharacterized protein YndB with AHSA1/START domain
MQRAADRRADEPNHRRTAMLKKILGVIVLAIAAVLIYAATKPDTFTLQRSASIAAPPDKIYPLIADMKAFNTWNAWALKDPTAKMTYEGPASGVGAAYGWDSDALGAGRMEVTEAAPPSRVAAKLEFKRPFEVTNRVEFTLQPQGTDTQVTWAMSGPMPYVSKLMTTFVSMDRMVGPDFETGLANLKALAEKR